MEIEKIKKTGLILLFSSNLFFFAAAFYFYQDHASLSEQLREVAESRDTLMAEKVTLQAENLRLKNRLDNKVELPHNSGQEIANLEKLLELREEELVQLKKQLEHSSQPAAGISAQENASSRRRGGNMQERIERLKEENPEEYERIQNRMAEFRKSREEQIDQRELFFKNLDLAQLSNEQRSTLTEYQDLLTRNDEVLNTLGQGEQPADFQEIMEQSRALHEMSETVRDILLQNLGKQIGTGGEVLSDNVKEILQITSPAA
ncbi:MAG: hypothetical protein WCT05_03700, partial [Lentisphaeria bacterium]